MTADPKTRDLALRLVAYEAAACHASELEEAATLRVTLHVILRVYEKLRQSLGEFAGADGFHALSSRALALARTEALSLDTVRVTADGALLGLGEFDPQPGCGRDQAGEGGIILIAILLGQLRIFLGEALTSSLLRNAWPGEAFDDRNSAHGRNA
jgi:hypothetical protein